MRLDCSGMEFEKLADLLEQGQFELLNLPVGDERKKPSDIRLVYMMNDTAESFLVFHEAVLTGNYLPDYEGELSASLDKEETDNTDAEGEERGGISWRSIREIQSAPCFLKISAWNVSCMIMVRSVISG